LKDLTGQEAKKHLRQYYLMNDRWNNLLQKRSSIASDLTYKVIREFDKNKDVNFELDQFKFLKTINLKKSHKIIADFGVYKGGSTRQLANIFKNFDIHGFDSFVGLEENWSYVLKGEFNLNSNIPKFEQKNIFIHPGWFEDSIPVFLKKVKFDGFEILRIDCDTYKPTKLILNSFKEKIKFSNYIIFDELFGYYGFEHHELKAFNEFRNENPEIVFELVSYGLTHAIFKINVK
jgi:hypothetical protein